MDSEEKVRELRLQLWGAAETLRGSAVDRTDWKGYILPLIFLKRICDVWDEEFQSARDLYGDSELFSFEEIHRFQVPVGYHWKDIRETNTDIGAKIQQSMQEIERVNPNTLHRVFGLSDWSNRDKFTDELLGNLIEGFSHISLGNNDVSTDMIGYAYEYLVGKFADVTRRKKAGEFYTPRSVVSMMIKLLNPIEGETIYDPTCGTGGMLLAAIEHAKKNGGDSRTFFGKIYGQEKNNTTASIARMNLVLHGIEDFQIERGDTLLEPKFVNHKGGLATFDCVIANPPFSLKKWGREFWENDQWGRASYGIPPDNYGDLAFVQHMIASMSTKGTGRMAIVLPAGSLYRAASESKIRKMILEGDLVEAVIGLAENLFYGTPLAGFIVIFRRKKHANRINKVIFIDAQDLFRKGQNQAFLDQSHIDYIIQLYENYQNVGNRCVVVSIDEILRNEGVLNIARYIQPMIGSENVLYSDAMETFTTSVDTIRIKKRILNDELKNGGFFSE
jgi:type I restriction enzyme M protein